MAKEISKQIPDDFFYLTYSTRKATSRIRYPVATTNLKNFPFKQRMSSGICGCRACIFL